MFEIRYYFLLLAVLTLSLRVSAQGVSNKSDFVDGIYMNISEFRRNAPQRTDRIFNKIRIETNKEQNIATISRETADYFEVDGLSLNKCWGICVNKSPYIRIVDTLNYDNAHIIFVKLHVIGRLCYYYHRTKRIETIIMNIYNPITQQKVGEKAVANRQKMMAQKMFDFQSERMIDFDDKQLGEAIKSDEKLYKSWQELPRPTTQEQLFKLLLIYNERNPIDFEKKAE